MSKSQQEQVLTRRKVQNGKSFTKCQNQTLKHIKRIKNNCYIISTGLAKGFSYVKICGWNLLFIKLNLSLV